jgi:hypothetical protein
MVGSRGCYAPALFYARKVVSDERIESLVLEVCLMKILLDTCASG